MRKRVTPTEQSTFGLEYGKEHLGGNSESNPAPRWAEGRTVTKGKSERHGFQSGGKTSPRRECNLQSFQMKNVFIGKHVINHHLVK